MTPPFDLVVHNARVAPAGDTCVRDATRFHPRRCRGRFLPCGTPTLLPAAARP